MYTVKPRYIAIFDIKNKKVAIKPKKILIAISNHYLFNIYRYIILTTLYRNRRYLSFLENFTCTSPFRGTQHFRRASLGGFFSIFEMKLNKSSYLILISN